MLDCFSNPAPRLNNSGTSNWFPAGCSNLELWNRVHAYGVAGSHATEAKVLLSGVELVEMERPVLARALEPFPVSLRTLDALHLGTMDFLRSRGEAIKFASYDNRLIAAAHALGIPLAAL